MKRMAKYIILSLFMLLFISCYTANSGKKQVVNTNGIELQIIDAETEEPLPNVSVRYYLRAERPVKGFIYASEYDYFSIAQGELLSNYNGTIFIQGNEYEGRSFDLIKLYIHININIDIDGIVRENENRYGIKPDKNTPFVDFGFRYFVFYDFQNFVTIMNNKYYPAYVLIFNMEGKDSYIINQTNKTGDRELDFQHTSIDNIIYYNDSQKLIVKLLRQ